MKPKKSQNEKRTEETYLQNETKRKGMMPKRKKIICSSKGWIKNKILTEWPDQGGVKMEQNQNDVREMQEKNGTKRN